MKKIISFIVFLICSYVSFGQIHQPPAVYGKREYRTIADSAMQGPTGCGAPTSLRSVVTTKYAQYYDSCNKRFYLYDPKLAAWDTLHVGAISVSTNYWGLTGNPGLTDANFVGTTDLKSLWFRVNNTKSGGIDVIYANSSLGMGAMGSNTTGQQNVAIGTSALSNNITGTGNSAFGMNSLLYNSMGGYNTAAGVSSMESNTTGAYNTAIGTSALNGNTTGQRNTAVGFGAMVANDSGYYNAAFGSYALGITRNGYRNTAVGDSAGYNNTTGYYNTYLGYSSGLGITTGGSNTIIGARVTGLTSSLANNIILADGAGNQRLNFNSSGAMQFTGGGFGTAGYLLQSNGSVAVPTFVNPASVVIANAWGLSGNTLTGGEYIGSNNDIDFPVVVNGTTVFTNSEEDVAFGVPIRVKNSMLAPASTASGSIYYNIASGTFQGSISGTYSPFVTGNGTLNYIPKWTPSGTVLGNSLIYDNGTNVGIGTASPSATLQIIGSGATSATKSFQIKNSTPDSLFTVANDGTVTFSGASAIQGGYLKFLRYNGDNLGQLYAHNSAFMVLNGTTETRFQTGGISAMTINSSQNVGIGSTTVSAKLHVTSTTEQLRLGYDASNYYSTTIGSTGIATFNAVGSGSSFEFSDRVAVPKLKGNSSTPSIAGGVGAGTSPTVSITGTDLAGEITVTTDADPAAGQRFCTITFAVAYGTAPYVVITPSNDAAALMSFDSDVNASYSTQVFVSSTTSIFRLSTNSKAAPAAETEFKWHYHVIQ